uniref:Aminotransferase-like plant mobile domain-containing protein n=1 Tax=Oryza punctata TaxID=4537 RepID=A0A0E0K2F5_ORYPU
MLVYDIFVEGYNVQRVMRQMGLYQQVPLPTGLHLPPDMHTQKRQADNRYHRSMHLRMTPWIEAWSKALSDVVHETRAYDHNTYEQYMAWYSSLASGCLHPRIPTSEVHRILSKYMICSTHRPLT